QDGNLTTTTDRDGRRRDLTYDDDGRLTSGTWHASDGITVLDALTYTFDADGNVLTAANHVGTYTMTYDDDGRTSTQTDPFGLTLTFAYDAAGNVSSAQDSLGGLVESQYDGDNQLLRRQFSGSGLPSLRVDLAWDADGRLSTVTRYSDLAGTQRIGT